MKWDYSNNHPIPGSFHKTIDLGEHNEALKHLLRLYYGESYNTYKMRSEIERFIISATQTYAKGNLSFNDLSPELQKDASRILFTLRFQESSYNNFFTDDISINTKHFIDDVFECCKSESLIRLSYCDLLDAELKEDTNDWFKKVYADFLQLIIDGCIEEDKLWSILENLSNFYDKSDYMELYDKSTNQAVREEILKAIIEFRENGVII